MSWPEGDDGHHEADEEHAQREYDEDDHDRSEAWRLRAPHHVSHVVRMHGCLPRGLLGHTHRDGHQVALPQSPGGSTLFLSGVGISVVGGLGWWTRPRGGLVEGEGRSVV